MYLIVLSNVLLYLTGLSNVVMYLIGLSNVLMCLIGLSNDFNVSYRPELKQSAGTQAFV